MKLLATFMMIALGASFATRAAASAVAPTQIDELRAIAARSLRANIVHLPSGPYLVAGQHQFKTLWTRDFCYSIRGLLKIGRADVVKNHLSALIQNARAEDGLVPRVMDSMSVQVRVVLSQFQVSAPINDPLKPSYLDEHGSAAIDSNALVVLGALDYVDATGDTAWWNANAPKLARILKFYESRRRVDGLVVQSAFSDWQDSVKRDGATAYANLLYWRALSRVVDKPEFGVNAKQVESLGAQIRATFLRGGLYHSLESGPQVSLDANLLALHWGFETADFYRTLRASKIWKTSSGVPGEATIPDYPASDKNLTIKLVGVSGYHDRATWSWLIALSAHVAREQGDASEATRIETKLAQVAKRNGVIGEIYDTEPTLPLYYHWIYRSEAPFSWGAASVLE